MSEDPKQIEQACIGCVLLDSRTTLDMCSEKNIKPGHFTDSACRKIFETALQYHAEGRVLDIRIISNHFSGAEGQLGQSKFFEDLVDIVTTPHHAPYYYDILAQAYTKKQINLIAKEMKALDSNESCSVDELVSKAQSLVLKLNRHKNAPQKDDARKNIVRNYTGAMNGECIGLPSPMPMFDRITGGPRKGLHTILAGPRGTGKSSVMTNWVGHLGKLGMATGVLPMEDGTERFWARLASSYGGYAEWNLATGNSNQELIQYANDSLEKVMSWPIYADGHRGMTIDEIKSKASQYKAQYDIQSLWLDGFKDIRKERSDTLAEDARISAGLCDIASTLDIAVVSVHHVTKASSKSEESLQLEDIRGNGAILDDARMVLILQDGFVLDCQKNNFGPTCAVTLDVDLAMCRISQAKHQDPRYEQLMQAHEESGIEVPFGPRD